MACCKGASSAAAAAGGKSFLWRGLSTLKIPLDLFSENRNRIIDRLHDEPQNSVIVLEGGVDKMRDDTDHELDFRQESFFNWTFGVEEPGFLGLIHLGTRQTTLLMPRLPAEYATWMGAIKSREHFLQTYETDRVEYADTLGDILESIAPEKIFVLKGVCSDSGSEFVPPSHPALAKYAEITDSRRLYREMGLLRSTKTKKELDVMRYVCKISSQGHVHVMQNTRPGMMEYQLESLFHHYCYFHGGCRFCAYHCICATGDNSSILHYGHAGEPNNRLLGPDDIALFDMGAEYFCYGADITCSFPVSGKFNEKQRFVYETVLLANRAVLNAMKPGVNWVDLHLLAEKVIVQRLIEHGILLGDYDEIDQNEVGALFFPHGLGHLLGLDTHDTGGYGEGLPERPKRKGVNRLRTARNLEEGMVITVEPGLYFNRSTLVPAFDDPKIGKFLNREKIEGFFDFGGVRIEDDVLVTADGYELLSDVPRDVDDIEAVMAGASWPLQK